MLSANIDQLGIVATETAMRAAAEYLRLNEVTIVDFRAATEIIREKTKAALGTALEDSKKALDCGMDQAAVATFKASFVQAGIDAGKAIQAEASRLCGTL